ncbi:MAG: HvfC/BufC family peptide modification chaperone [Candidatus Binataceae bacterium]
MAMQLKELEQLLCRLIAAPNGVAEGLAAERGLPSGGLEAIVRGDERLPAFERVSIYANMYFYRLLDVLKDDFPATLKAIGDANFHNLVTGYLLEYPPTEPSVHYCGRHLAAHLRGHPLREKFPYLADLAALERALVESFQAADAAPLDAAAMRSIPAPDWPALRFAMHPAVAILTLDWRVSESVRAVENGSESGPVMRGPARTVVWRHNCRVFHRDLEPSEAGALDAASRGEPFARICEVVGADAGQSDRVAEASRLLNRWLADGILLAAPAAAA